MEMLVYLIGNWCGIGAGLIVILHYLRPAKKSTEREFQQTHDSERDIMISSDLLIMLFLGACVRVYWSLSPPPIW